MKTEIMQSSSPQNVASLDDLITQILLNLPIRSLIRFKSVSHHWNSLISDPHFCFLRNPNPNPAVGFFTTHLNRSYEYVPLSGGPKSSTNPPFPNKLFNDPHETIAVQVQQSCNGLLLCCMFSSREYVNIFYVCNPIRDETDRDSFLVLQILGKVIRYNIVSQSFETIYEFASAKVEGCMSYLDSGFQYIESLCCV